MNGTARSMSAFWKLAAAAALLASCAQPATEQANTDLLFRNATLIDGTGSPPQAGVDILVSAGKVVAVGKALAVPAKGLVIDATGKFVMPGIIDAHTHLHSPVLAQLTADERKLMEAHTPRAFLYNGVTTVLNAGSNPRLLEERQAQREGRLVGPRIFALSESIKPEGGWGSRHGGAMKDALSARHTVEEAAAAHADGIKIIIESGLGDEITHVEIPEDMLQVVVEAAKTAKLGTYIHAIGIPEYRRSVGIGPVAIIHGLGERLAADDPLIAELAAKNVAVVHTASLFRSFLAPDPRAGANLDDPVLVGSVPAFMLAKMRTPGFMQSERDAFVKVSKIEAYQWAEKANPNICENIGKMHRGGVKTAVGTDAGGTVGYNFQGYNTPWEVKILTECGLTPMEALVAATRNGAEVIGVADTLGTVEPGKIADMLILSADPLQNIENIRAIEWIVQDGKLHPRNEFAYKTGASRP
ncbi:amidohydrolase family protein [Sphingosinicella microcystinivorans]|uniref:amidohydrolase family protein n=1 Tax=Sphingosinicella microcystinivorans TaxID=335406 RepID=UPI0022F3B5FD|nr:amidohydrolase family protein [Sphingosinicella microcystinivorans]WBX84159.1 amidohydrolase family protein [Sphingosinicella microcystinivorans]